jgi:hypothetical protein
VYTVTTTNLTIPAETLKRIVDVVYPAAAGASPLVPTHFTESCLIYPDSTQEGAMAFCCVDGFRMHTVQLYDTSWGDAEDKSDRIVVGATWLREVAAAAADGTMVTIAAGKLPGNKMGEEWKTEGAVDNHGKVLVEGQTFNLGGRWPDVRSLIHHDEIVFGDNGVGLHPEYFRQVVESAMDWWDEMDDPSESFPLVVREMAPNKVSSFSIVNSLGRLQLSIMPKVLDSDDY